MRERGGGRGSPGDLLVFLPATLFGSTVGVFHHGIGEEEREGRAGLSSTLFEFPIMKAGGWRGGKREEGRGKGVEGGGRREEREGKGGG